MKHKYGQGVKMLCGGREIAEVEQMLESTRARWRSPVDQAKIMWSACSHVHFKGARDKEDLEADKWIHYRAADAADAGSGDARPEPSAASSSGAAAPVADSVVEKSREWKPPTKDELAEITRQYSKPGREMYQHPKSRCVVLGYRITNGNRYFAYCFVCTRWMDWPPRRSNFTVGPPFLGAVLRLLRGVF